MEKKLILVLIEDVADHADRLKELSQIESPDYEQIEYHHSRLNKKLELLKGAIG